MSLHKAKVIDQKEYLKRYLSGDKEKKKKKKHKKEKKEAVRTVKIIDDDDYEENDADINEELLFGGEDAPQIVGEYIEHDPNVRKKWRNIAVKDEPSDDVPTTSNGSVHVKQEPTDESNLWGRENATKKIKDEFSPSAHATAMPAIKIKQEKRSCSPEEKLAVGPPRDSDLSPPRRRDRDVDQSLPRKRRDSDQSPPRRRRLDDDLSPPRRRRDSDQSPPRRRGREVDQSLPRKRRDSDQSPPRRRRPDDDLSPPRRRLDSDQSPPRRRGRDVDQSLPRKRRDSDQSPPRRRRPAVDQSPPRRRRSKSREHSPSHRRQRSRSRIRKKRRSESSDQSPARRIKKEPRSSTPPATRKSRWQKISPNSSPSPPPTHKGKTSRTLDGKKAGLQDAKSLKAETDERRRKEQRLFEQMSSDVSGRNAEVQVRSTGRRGRRARDAANEDPEERRRKEENAEKVKAVYDRWGKGVKQVEEREARLAEMVHEASKPVARYADDEDLERHLREKEYADDPMLEYMRKKRKKEQQASGKPIKPVYEGTFPENRYGIRPGYRWDGVDRSNGYEKRLFEKQSAKRAAEEEAYLYSVEDM